MGHQHHEEMPVYSIEAAIADAVDRLERAPDQAPASDIEHWIWTGTRLVRASPQPADQLRLLEILERMELQHLREMQRAYRRARWQSYRRLVVRLISPLRSLLQRWRS